MVKNWEFSAAVRHVERTTSTQDEVKAAARAGAGPGFCCVADEQTAGRGRAERAWVAPAGSSLLASVLLRVAPASAPLIPLLAGVAAVRAVRALTSVDARLKWPNDVMLGRRKLAGILCEALPQDGTGGVPVVVGIGMNLTVTDFPPDVPGVSLHTMAPPVSRDAMLSRWLGNVARGLSSLERNGAGATLDAWRACAVGLGKTVTVQVGSRTLTGVAVDIDEDGALLVRSGDALERVLAGDVHVLDWS